VKDKIVIRPAKPSDKAAVLELCRHSFAWGDYVPDVWDEWIKERHTMIFSATQNDVPVGIMRVSLPKPEEAWLQAARTHPDHRRRGIATALAKACLKWAEDNGARIARLSTDSDNYAAHRALEKMHFTRVSDFLIVKCRKLQSNEAQNCRWASESDLATIWEFLNESDIFEAAGRLYSVLFVWKSLEREDLERFVANRRALAHFQGDAVDGLVLVDDAVRKHWEDEPIQACYIDGSRPAVAEMMRFLKAYSQGKGFKKVYAFACNIPLVSEALIESGFTRDDSTTEFIYEKALGP
jgi:ribosomal protein S18 acetylase RimI-like enzyme